MQNVLLVCAEIIAYDNGMMNREEENPTPEMIGRVAKLPPHVVLEAEKWLEDFSEERLWVICAGEDRTKPGDVLTTMSDGEDYELQIPTAVTLVLNTMFENQDA